MKKYKYVVQFKDGVELEVWAMDHIEAEHLMGVARRRKNEDSRVANVYRKRYNDPLTQLAKQAQELNMGY